MFDAFRDFLRQIGIEGPPPADAGDDPRVAAAALLFHVVAADGVVSPAEVDALQAALRDAFGVDARESARLADAGGAADEEAVDLYSFTQVLMRHFDEAARVRFVALLWSVTFADGAVHELEDNIVWRIADLLGVSTRDRMLGKQAAARRLGIPAEGEPS